MAEPGCTAPGGRQPIAEARRRRPRNRAFRYSDRKVDAGSIRSDRHAGTAQATSAAATSTAGPPTISTGSR